MIGAFSVSYLVIRVKNKGTLGGVSFTLIAICSIVSQFLPITTSGGQIIYYVMMAGVGLGSGHDAGQCVRHDARHCGVHLS